MLDSTLTDPDGDWNIVDSVVQLRRWGESDDSALALPSAAFAEEVIGAAPTCSMKLDDKSRRVSREHARLVRRGVLWTIHDLHSKNGTWIDGTRRNESALTPGALIRLGGVVLVAESPNLVALRELLCRWIGWIPERRADVDQALRAVRTFSSERTPLVLSGDGDLTPIASRLHRQTLGSRPFIVHQADEDIATAIDRATGGTLCIPVTQAHHVAAAITLVGTRVQKVRVMLCAPTFQRAAPIVFALGRTVRLDLPTLSNRRGELPTILREYTRDFARDAEVILRMPALIADEDIAILARGRYKALAEIESDVRKLVALRTLGVRRGEQLLGLKQSTLSKWAKRRRIPATR